MSSANHKLQSSRPPMDTDDNRVSGSSASSTASSVNSHSLTGDNGHRCHTPTVIRKKSPAFPLSSTALVDFDQPVVNVVFL